MPLLVGPRADHVAAVVKSTREANPVARGLGIVVTQLLVKRDQLSPFGLRLGRAARFREQDAKIKMAVRQSRSRFGDGRVVVDQLLINRHPLAIFHFRLHWFARLGEEIAQIVAAACEISLELGHGGVVVSKLCLITIALWNSTCDSAVRPD